MLEDLLIKFNNMDDVTKIATILIIAITLFSIIYGAISASRIVNMGLDAEEKLFNSTLDRVFILQEKVLKKKDDSQ